VVGLANVPLLALTLLLPLTKLVLVPEVVTVKVYPLLLSVSTATLSLWIVHLPLGAGETFRLTLLLLETVMLHEEYWQEPYKPLPYVESAETDNAANVKIPIRINIICIDRIIIYFASFSVSIC
jgi:hypothetical protein